MTDAAPLPELVDPDDAQDALDRAGYASGGSLSAADLAECERFGEIAGSYVLAGVPVLVAWMRANEWIEQNPGEMPEHLAPLSEAGREARTEELPPRLPDVPSRLASGSGAPSLKPLPTCPAARAGRGRSRKSCGLPAIRNGFCVLHGMRKERGEDVPLGRVT